MDPKGARPQPNRDLTEPQTIEPKANRSKPGAGDDAFSLICTRFTPYGVARELWQIVLPPFGDIVPRVVRGVTMSEP